MRHFSEGYPAPSAHAAPAAFAPAAESLIDRAARVAEIARAHAVSVDAEARLPIEALRAAKAERLLGAMVPVHLGGEGARLAEMADLCFTLGQACSSTAMIFAMHQIKAACLIRHHGGSAWQIAFLRRIAFEQLLLASSTTEGRAGGALRSSEAPIEPTASGVRLRRDASVMSYGEYADAIVTTARRDAQAAPADQVLAVFVRDGYRLERTAAWDTLGMRGTRSQGFNLEAEGDREQVLAAPYAEIHAQTMAPVAHILWASAWAGIAAEATERARQFTRKASRAGSPPPGAPHLVRAKTSLDGLYALISTALARHAALEDQPDALAALDYQTQVALLKVQASELAVATVMSAMRTCGLSGYRNDGDASMGRLLRDVLSSPLMINNDRILADLAPPALMDRTPRAPFAGAF
jgi:acyl-CoA dehydrogenase